MDEHTQYSPLSSTVKALETWVWTQEERGKMRRAKAPCPQKPKDGDNPSACHLKTHMSHTQGSTTQPQKGEKP